MRKLLITAVAMLLAGTAYVPAQTTEPPSDIHRSRDEGARSDQERDADAAQERATELRLLNDNKFMRSFYMDDNMSTMKEGSAMRTAYDGIRAEDRTRLQEECQFANSPRATFCQSIRGYQQ